MLKSEKAANWEKMEDVPEKGKAKKILAALSFFMQKPEKALQASGIVNMSDADIKTLTLMQQAGKLTTGGDTPNAMADLTRIIDKYHAVVDGNDFGYTDIFRLIDMRKTKQDHFEMGDISSGIEWVETKNGERAKLNSFNDVVLKNVYYRTFRAGLQFAEDWFRYQKWYLIDDAAIEFRNKYYEKKAIEHYQMLDAMTAAINQPFVNDDVKTINIACAAIIRALAGKGLGVHSKTPFILVAPPELAGRIMYALYGSYMQLGKAKQEPLVYSVKPLFTHLLSATDKYYIGVPGKKAARGEWLDMTIKSKEDILLDARLAVGKAQYNAIIGEQDQFRRCSIA